ncbi:MAG: S8 family serine peptidase [Corynebacterium sp.]|nr:S8 family serine peptidase [Corynebacterium sp.]
MLVAQGVTTVASPPPAVATTAVEPAGTDTVRLKVSTAAGEQAAVAARAGELGRVLEVGAYYGYFVVEVGQGSVEKLRELPGVVELSEARPPFRPGPEQPSEGKKRSRRSAPERVAGYTNMNDAESKAYYGQTLREMMRVDDESATGAGVKVGVISDSFGRCPGVEQSRAEGALPEVTVLREASWDCWAGASDEGRGMLEIIHQIAPEAELYFAASGEDNESAADATMLLARAGVDVIVDDILTGDEPTFHYSPWSKAIMAARSQGILYFAAAGNEAMYDSVTGTPSAVGAVTGEFVPWPCPEWANIPEEWPCMQFGSQGYDSFTLADVFNGGNNTWRPYFATSVLNDGTRRDTAHFAVHYYLEQDDGTFQQFFRQESDARGSGEIGYYQGFLYRGEQPVHYVVVQRKAGSAPRYHVKHIASLGRAVATQQFSAAELAAMGFHSGTVFGHSADGSAVGVGAVVADGTANNVRADYSAIGSNCIYYDGADEPVYQENCFEGLPQIYGVTGAVTRNFPEWTNSEGLHIFNGTSAAAPAVAAVAALIRQKIPGWNPDFSELSRILPRAVNPSDIEEDSPLGGIMNYSVAMAHLRPAVSPLLRTVGDGYTTGGTTDAGVIDLATGTLSPVAGFHYAYDADFTDVVDPAAVRPGATIYVRYQYPNEATPAYAETRSLQLPGRYDAPAISVSLAPSYDFSKITLGRDDTGQPADIRILKKSDGSEVYRGTMATGAALNLSLPNDATYELHVSIPGDDIAFASVPVTHELSTPEETEPPTALPAKPSPKPEPKPEPEPQPKPEPKPTVRPEPDPAPPTNSEKQPEPSEVAKPEVTAPSLQNYPPEAGTKPSAEPKSEPSSEPKNEPKPEPPAKEPSTPTAPGRNSSRFSIIALILALLLGGAGLAVQSQFLKI